MLQARRTGHGGGYRARDGDSAIARLAVDRVTASCGRCTFTCTAPAARRQELAGRRRQKGYHTKLERAGSVWRFTDKAGNVHHFESPDQEGRPRLDFLEEPHGDRLVFTYDLSSRLVKVAEVQAEAGEVRAITFAYRTIAGFDRITKAEIAPLGLSVEYEYDGLSNLTKATRNGQNLAGSEITATEPRVERYRYLSLPAPAPGQPPTPINVLKQHQLVAVTDPNGHSREYVYHAETDTLPGEAEGRAGGLFFPAKWELVKQVVEHPDPALRVQTAFAYDLTHWPSAQFWTTVRDGRGNDTRYILNGNGNPLRIEEPLGKTTTMVWAAADIFKTKETDPLGRVTDYGYDERGNLTSERINTADMGIVPPSAVIATRRFNEIDL